MTIQSRPAIVNDSQHEVMVSFEAGPRSPPFKLDAPLEPEPQARQRAPDQFFAENSKGQNEHA
ncbi:hypothetical protein, partial [Burkholderia sp.]|uniref:hypothetical protein n=1 Tax=Burkholderia sp. TaxID=36773 RepID=UPI002590DC1C